LSAHVGNWEIAGNLLHDRIQKPIHYTMLDDEKREIRNAFGKAFMNRRISIIPVNQEGMGFIVDILDALRKNEIVCMHGDRMFGKRGASVSFFNSHVTFPIGPFAIAAATDAPIIPIFTYKRGLWRYVFRAFDPIDVNGHGEDRDSRIQEGQKKYVDSLELVAKENPYEWFNFYDFWEEDAVASNLNKKEV